MTCYSTVACNPRDNINAPLSIHTGVCQSLYLYDAFDDSPARQYLPEFIALCIHYHNCTRADIYLDI